MQLEAVNWKVGSCHATPFYGQYSLAIASSQKKKRNSFHSLNPPHRWHISFPCVTPDKPCAVCLFSFYDFKLYMGSLRRCVIVFTDRKDAKNHQKLTTKNFTITIQFFCLIFRICFRPPEKQNPMLINALKVR